MSLAKTVYKFQISVTLVDRESGESRSFSDSLTSFRAKCDYVSNVYPLVVLTFAMTDAQINMMSQGDYDFGVTIRRAANLNVQGEDDISSSDLTYDKTVLEDTFRPFAKPSVEKIKSSDSSATDGDDSAVLNQQKSSYTVRCVSVSMLKANEGIANAVYHDCTLSDAMVNVISSKFEGNAYIQEIDVKDIQSNILIPPLNLVPALRFLQGQYSIYSNGINMFFDGGKLFVYDIENLSRDSDNLFGINVVNATQNTDGSLYQYFQVDDSTEETDIYLKNTPAIGNGDDLYGNDIGTEAMMGSFDEGYNLVSRSYEPGYGSTKKIRYFWNERRTEATELGAIRELTKMMTLTVPNFDPSMVDPGTNVTLSGSTIEYANGRYALYQKIYSMTSQDFKYFTSSVTFVFAK